MAVTTSIVVVVAVVAWLRHLGHEEASRRLAVMGMGRWAPAIAIGLMMVLVVTPGVTSDLFGIVNGALFGPVLGAAVNWSGTLAGSAICYLIGRQAGRTEWVAQHLERLPRRVRGWAVASLPFLLFVRYVPAIGGTLVNYSAGALGVSIGRFLWTAAVSTLPPAAFWAVVGHIGRG